MSMRMIEIDFDVHKVIEANRTSFEDTPNSVLRRLLDLPGDQSDVFSETLDEDGAWTDGLVVLPAFTELRMTYNRQHFRALVRNGKWHDDQGGIHTSPSGAACSLARTKDGKKTHLNGKNYWEVRLPNSSEWVLYAELERRVKSGSA